MSKEKTYTVKTPNPNFTGTRNGVQFSKGKGEATKQQAIELVGTWGYECPALEEAEQKKEPEAETVTEVKRPATDATNDELRAFMDEHSIAYESDDNKADLNDKIDAWLAEQES